MPLRPFVSILKTPTGSVLPISSVQVTQSPSTCPLVSPVTWHMELHSRRLRVLASFLVLAPKSQIYIFKGRFRNPVSPAECPRHSGLLSSGGPAALTLHRAAQYMVTFAPLRLSPKQLSVSSPSSLPLPLPYTVLGERLTPSDYTRLSAIIHISLTSIISYRLIPGKIKGLNDTQIYLVYLF